MKPKLKVKKAQKKKKMLGITKEVREVKQILRTYMNGMNAKLKQ